MFLFLLLSLFVRAEDSDGDDFWDQLADDDVVIDDKVTGNLYDKARFNLPVRRRLKLYPQVSKTVKYLQGRQNIEFIYEARIPTLVFLDSDDVTVDTIDISKMSHDEIIALLALRGFKDIEDEPLPKTRTNSTSTNETTAATDSTETSSQSASQEAAQQTDQTTKEL
ncbi:hypothetical protein TRFO_17836 [Tritrichomonas foetus]|uniref:Selenoprotein F/M domain-containing protein n=1 Tax=Tritrichomonas foetus TaxID=1144522 RepID=A0A1J4KM18_9EUKA|nr:hypothetical protein TRFO_17836 [Tritrichomonas foetus]|eukprot:OHT12359.1 hypothetical protein TRFO_17836 [Tritrichomonas foetus]